MFVAPCRMRWAAPPPDAPPVTVSCHAVLLVPALWVQVAAVTPSGTSAHPLQCTDASTGNVTPRIIPPDSVPRVLSVLSQPHSPIQLHAHTRDPCYQPNAHVSTGGLDLSPWPSSLNLLHFCCIGEMARGRPDEMALFPGSYATGPLPRRHRAGESMPKMAPKTSTYGTSNHACQTLKIDRLSWHMPAISWGPLPPTLP